jgi:hypothetical protein
MQHVFGDHIGRTVEVYIDDIVVKTRKADDLVNDLLVAFDCLRANRVKLNPEKCVFGVSHGMLLGYIISQQGIEPNLEKVSALDRMGPIRDLKGVQKVLGFLAALSSFISRLDEKGLPLYQLLKKHDASPGLLRSKTRLTSSRRRSHTRRSSCHLEAVSLCTSTSRRPPRWSARSSSWSERRKVTPY